MKRILYVSLLTVFLTNTFQYISAYAQEKTTSILKDKLQTHLEKSPIEKVHLHLDKPYYNIGDDIWYKAYVQDDGNVVPSLISGVLYIDLVDQKSKLIKSLKLPLLNGVTWGGFKLPENIAEGTYSLIAYTQWMRNAGSDFFFKKELLIKDSQRKNNTQNVAIRKDIDVQFFPEGGTMVEDLPCKIGFKVTNQNGIGEFISGSIYDSDGLQIVNFESSYLGMGNLSITPQSGKTYTAKIKFKDNSEKSYALPSVSPAGNLLSVNTSNPENFIIKILTSASLLGQQELNLLVHHNGKVYLESKLSTAKQITVIPLKTTDLPSGIITITLLNSKIMPIGERIVFVNNNKRRIDIVGAGIMPTYSPRSAINMDIQVAVGKSPVQGSFSISTTNTSLVAADTDNETHILSSLLLKSDLVGNIEKPNGYFTDNAQQNNERIDYLMLTQGWRKISWKNLLENPVYKQEFDVEKQLRISGTIQNAGKVASNMKVSILSTPSVVLFRDTTTDQSGRFIFNKLNFKEGTKFVIKALTPNVSKIKITIDTTQRFIPQIAKYANVSITDSLFQSVVGKYNEVTKIANDAKAINPITGKTLKTVNINGVVNKAPNSENLNGAGNADATFGTDDLKNTFSLNSFLQGQVSGIQLYNNKFFLSRGGVGMDNSPFMNKPQPMRIIVDGSMIDEGTTLDDFTVGDIESIEILKSIGKTFVYGTNDGVILITTKAGKNTAKSGSNTDPVPGMLTVSPQGFEITRKFYVPKYDVITTKTPDVRSTVFWEPNLITDKDGKAKISYFNADIPGVYRMVIEGIDVDGNLARKTYTYKVN